MAYTYKTEVWINDHNIIGGYGLERPLEYSIQLDGEEIYCGRDVALDPQEATNFTDIFEDYLECEGLAHLQETDYLEWEESAYRKFELYYNDVLQTTFYFLRGYDQFWDYSLYGDYMTPWQGSSQCLSEPINSHIDPRMKILHTDFKATTAETIVWGYVPRVTILTSKIEATAERQTAHFTIDSNCNYSASTVDDWLVVRPVQATAGTKTFDVYLQGNSGETREGSVVISYRDEYDNLVTETIPVTQYQTRILYLNPETQTLPASAEDYGTIEVIADGPYFFGIEEDWLSISSISGSSGDTIYTIIPEINTQPSGRTAIITVGLNDYVTVSQEAASISVSPSTIIAQPSAGAYLFEVTSNIPFTATTTQGWITLDQTTGETGVTEIEVAVPNYTGTTDRLAVITIGYQTVAVSQKALLMTVSPSSFLVPASGETIEFSVISNGNYDITADSWIITSAASGESGTTTYTALINSNMAEETRGGMISIGNQSISITQRGNERDYSLEYLTFEVISGGSIVLGLSTTGSGSTNRTIEYSTDGETWNSQQIYNTGHTLVSYAAPGDKIYFRATNAMNQSISEAVYPSDNCWVFENSTAAFDVYGNLLSLKYNNDFSGKTDIGNYRAAYGCLFRNTKVRNAAHLILPTDDLPYGAFIYMFQNCSGLTQAPALPATDLSNVAGHPYSPIYAYMFAGCSSLVEAPDLPATTLAVECYASMFKDCTSLVSVPSILPATELKSYCYSSMFAGCTSLTTAPILPAEYLPTHCYISMFGRCSSLNYVKCLAKNSDSSATGNTSAWLANVAATGTFERAANSYWVWGSNGIPTGWTVTPSADTGDYLTFDIISAGTITWKASSSSAFRTISYSLDSGNTWTDITSSTGGTAINVSAGDSVMFKGDNGTIASHNSYYNRFNGTAYFNARGYVGSIINSDFYKGQPKFVAEKLFFGARIVDASNLIIDNIGNSYDCYGMFSGCTSLTTAPSLPATKLADGCYGHMFEGCRGLTTAPTLPATALTSSCYAYMFAGCTSLSTAPVLPVETLANYCYNGMFSGCTSLQAAPALPATTLAKNCYASMFNGCTNLTTAPALPATILQTYCYSGMFEGCRSLTTAPTLPATALTGCCYTYMFSGCTSLNYVKCLATSFGSYSTYYWLSGVAATGTFVKDSNTTWSGGISGIPSGWTVEDA